MEKESKTKKKLFARFLKENNIYGTFVKEHIRDYGCNAIDTVMAYEPCGWISEAFIWASTRKGVFFWNDVSNKWSLFFRMCTKKHYVD